MKTRFARYIKIIFPFLKRKLDFSFLNAAGVLLVLSVVFIPLHLKQVVETKLKQNEKLALSGMTYRDLTYIKPFTSLLGFNRKFSEEHKRKSSGVKVPSLGFTFIDL